MYQSAAVAPAGTAADRLATGSLTTRDLPSALGAMSPSSSVSCGSLLPNVSVAVWAGLSHRALPVLVGGGGGGGSTSLAGVRVPSRVFMRPVTSGPPQPDT